MTKIQALPIAFSPDIVASNHIIGQGRVCRGIGPPSSERASDMPPPNWNFRRSYDCECQVILPFDVSLLF